MRLLMETGWTVRFYVVIRVTVGLAVCRAKVAPLFCETKNFKCRLHYTRKYQ